MASPESLMDQIAASMNRTKRTTGAGGQALAVAAILLAALPALLPGKAAAAFSQWHDLGGGEVRVAAAIDPETRLLSGMVEIRLKEGWKTYWRTPGSSGIPPVFDFSRSRGLVVGEVAFPVPERIEAGGAPFSGYRKSVAFVFEGQALGSNPELHLDLVAGVCDDICIPATASIEIDEDELATEDPRTMVEISLAQAHLPGLPRDGLRVTSAERRDGHIAMVAEIPAGETAPSLFLEAADGRYLPYPELVSAGDGKALFSVPEEVVAGAGKLNYTLVTGQRGVEGRLALP